MKDPTRRYDAWGNPILPHDQMKIYYRDNKEALEVLDQCMPCMYVCIPAVEIRIIIGGFHWVEITYQYPGGDRTAEKYPSNRAWEALRDTYKGKPGWKHRWSGSASVVLRREGTVIRDPSKKFGPWQ